MGWTQSRSSRCQRKLALILPKNWASKGNLSLALAIVCIFIFWVPYAAYFFLGPPSVAGLAIGFLALKSGDRRKRLLTALLVNAAALAFALLAAAAILGIVDW